MMVINGNIIDETAYADWLSRVRRMMTSQSVPLCKALDVVVDGWVQPTVHCPILADEIRYRLKADLAIPGEHSFLDSQLPSARI